MENLTNSPKTEKSISTSGQITNNLKDKIHSKDAVLTLFSISNAQPNSLFSFSIDMYLSPNELGKAPNTPGYWYEAALIINGIEVNRFTPPSTNALPLVINWEIHNLKSDNNGQIIIKLINIHTEVWPTQIVNSIFQKSSTANLSYLVI